MMHFSLPGSARLIDLASGTTLGADDIKRKIALWQTLLQGYDAKRVVLTADSSASWVLVDLACLLSDITITPLPTYLSAAQRKSVLHSLQPDIWLSDVELNESGCSLLEEFDGLLLYQRQVEHLVTVPADTQKITFTSGSTGAPKGVCLSARSQLDVAISLKVRVEHICEELPRHLCLLPLPTLLENVAGVYAPLLAGGDVLIAADSLRGFSGSRLVAPQQLLQLISQVQPKSLILVPELLQLLLQAIAQGWHAPTSLEFIAVGGAYVSAQLMQQAAAAGLPVYQGYGLSECGSVVALSDTSAAQAGDAVGSPLACRDVQIIDGELVVNTPFLGYLGELDSAAARVYTGDLAKWNANGELQILGRRKNLLINSFGRNISPEWVEAALTDSGLIQQAMLLGDAKPYCAALLYAPPTVSEAQLAEAVRLVNQQLPDYARVMVFHRIEIPFSQSQGTLTANGRLRRNNILQGYASAIAALFSHDHLATGASYELLPISA